MRIERLVLGTVQFGMDYVVKKVSPAEVYKILHYAHDIGIDTLDTAYAYGNYDILSSFMNETGKRFEIISKIKTSWELWPTLEYFPKLKACLTHGFDEELLEGVVLDGMSIYETNEIRDCDILQVPMIDEFIPLLDEHYHLRSIFGRGRKLKSNTVGECLEKAFNTKAGKIVVGVDSLEHLRKIVKEVRSLEAKSDSNYPSKTVFNSITV